MDYAKALNIGRMRADTAAKALGRWTGIEAMSVCAVKPKYGDDPRRARDWKPVGEQSFKEIAQDDGAQGGGNYHLLIVDDEGTGKACSRKRFPLPEALRLMERLPLPVAVTGRRELSRRLEECELGTTAREHALQVEV